MKKKIKKQKPHELRPEYSFSKLKNGVNGKYAARFNAGTNLVLSRQMLRSISLTNSQSMPHCEL